MENWFSKIKQKRIWKSLVAYPAAAFVILQAVDFFISNYDLNPKLLTATLILLIGGFVISLIWNWNHGEKGDQLYTSKEWIAYGSVGIITLFFLGNYWLNSDLGSKMGSNINLASHEILAVLPFGNQSKDQDLVYLSDGIPENLINKLSRITSLKVLSRNSTFILEEADRNPKSIQNKLNADLMLTGRIEKLDDRLIVNCQLIDVQQNIQIWGDKISYHADNIVKVEEAIVASLMKTLQLKLKQEQSQIKLSETYAPEAQAHYMKGRALSYGSTQQEAEKALDHFREAIEIDPKYAAAYVGIANEKIVQAIFATASRETIFNEARTAIQTALAFNPNSAEAYYVDGAIKFYGDFNWTGAEESYKKSLEINPNNADAIVRYSAFLVAMKRYNEAIELADKAIELDPISISSLHNLGWVNLVAGNYEEAEQAFSEAIELHPTWIWGYVKRAYTRMFQNNNEGEEADANRTRELMSEGGSELLEAATIYIHSYCNNNQRVSELTSLFFNHTSKENYEDPFAVALVYYANGNLDKMFEWSQKCIDEKSPGAYQFNIDIFYDNDIRNNPRFIEIRKQMKFK